LQEPDAYFVIVTGCPEDVSFALQHWLLHESTEHRNVRHTQSVSLPAQQLSMDSCKTHADRVVVGDSLAVMLLQSIFHNISKSKALAYLLAVELALLRFWCFSACFVYDVVFSIAPSICLICSFFLFCIYISSQLLCRPNFRCKT
jgi:hypothetical protein